MMYECAGVTLLYKNGKYIVLADDSIFETSCNIIAINRFTSDINTALARKAYEYNKNNGLNKFIGCSQALGLSCDECRKKGENSKHKCALTE